VNAKGEGHPDIGEWCGRFPLRMVGTGEPLARSKAANMGLDNARGEYLIFLDDDDLFAPGHIAWLVEVLEREEGITVAYSGVSTTGCRPANVPLICNSPFNSLRLLVENYIPIHAVLFSCSLLNKGCRFDEGIDLCEDWDFWLQLAQFGPFLHVNQISAQYRFTNAVTSGVQDQSQITRDAILKIFHKWKVKWSDEQLTWIMRTSAQVTGLNHELTERGGQIEALNHELTERGGQIEALNHELTERGGQIEALNHELTERDGQIEALNHELTERGGQIEALNHELTERGGQIEALNHELIERDGQIEALNHELIERDGQIADFKASFSEIRESTSWRITAPFRFVVSSIKRIMR